MNVQDLNLELGKKKGIRNKNQAMGNRGCQDFYRCYGKSL
jgi:hypothetical protein